MAPKSITTADVADIYGRVVAIDEPLFLYKYLIAVRQDAESLKNDDGETTSHLSGFFYQTVKLLEHGIKPVYVFDGKAPSMKRGVLIERANKAKQAQSDLDVMKKDLDVKKVQDASNAKSVEKNKVQPFTKQDQQTVSNVLTSTLLQDTAAQLVKNKETLAETLGVIEDNSRKKIDNIKDDDKKDQIDNVKERRKLAGRTVRMTQQHQLDVIQLLTFMGIPIIFAPGEAEAQCATLCRLGLAHAVITEDMDALMFGAPRVLRGYSNTAFDQNIKEKKRQLKEANREKKNAKDKGKKDKGEKELTISVSQKVNGQHIKKSKTNEKIIEQVNLAIILKKLKMSMKQLIEFGILCGCDYTGTLPGIGPKNALKLMQEHETLDNVIKALQIEKKKKKPTVKRKSKTKKDTKEVQEDVVDKHGKMIKAIADFQYQEAYKLFEKPSVIDCKTTLEEQLVWKPINEKALTSFLVTDKQFNAKRVATALERLKTKK